tara:strand:- start:55 stop:705 length:651 start_codon:yes stop_codon:yes gene_type:complete
VIGEINKTCKTCKIEKPVNMFYKNKNTPDGYQYSCSSCHREYRKKYNIVHCDKNREYNKQYYKKHRERILEHKKQYRLQPCTKKRIEEYERSPARRKQIAVRQRERYKTDVEYKLRRRISASVYDMLVGRKKYKSILQCLPYTMLQLKEHLESQFDEHMTWENYGTYWHMDHIYPQSKLPYDSVDHDNFKRAWALNNLQPLEAAANIRKGNKIIYG